MKEMFRDDDPDHRDIIFSDETHIYLVTSPNKRNIKKWRKTTPGARSHILLYSANLSVWCGFVSSEVIRLFDDTEAGTHLYSLKRTRIC